jgi:hypothetical protein
VIVNAHADRTRIVMVVADAACVPTHAWSCRCRIRLYTIKGGAARRPGRRFFDGLLPSGRPSAPAARAALLNMLQLGRARPRSHDAVCPPSV